MSGRELVILLLGLAIVAVVLRGLYVAINARRGQIKLAIDKNIPQDVDLESLELAELPGGGARVVTRSLEEVNRQNSALDLAEGRAKSFNLSEEEDDSHIPVLMDTVELSEPAPIKTPAPSVQQEVEVTEDFVDEAGFAAAPIPEEVEDFSLEEQARSIEEEIEEDFVSQPEQGHSFGEDWDENETELEPAPVQEYVDHEADEQLEPSVENSDSVLFDYEEDQQEDSDENEAQASDDAMASIAPDYIDEPVEAGEELAETSDDDSYESASEHEDYVEPEADDESQPFDADSSADEFSMTAGERIGGNLPTIDEDDQSGLFDDVDENEVEDKPKSRPSLFSLFGRKSKSKAETELVDAERVIEEQEQASDEPDDVLLEQEFVQLDIEEAEYAEPSDYPQMDAEEEFIDELDQKRAANIEQEIAEPETTTEEFEHSEVLVLNVTAKDGRVFSGDDLLQVLITSGLKFGDMNIFHKRLSKEHQGTVIFSVANMLNPGTFDLNNMDDFTTLGISFFLALPSPINNLDAFEQMLGVAQEIRDTLGGDLKDDHRNGMTGQTIEHYRQRIRDFELRRLKAVAARG